MGRAVAAAFRRRRAARVADRPARARRPPTSVAGARDDLAALHAEHVTVVERWLARLGVPAADVDDAVQEVFVVVLRKWGAFRGESQVTTWLYGVCFRVAARFRRRAHLRRELNVGSDLATWLDAIADAPDHESARLDARHQLREAFASLDDGRRELLTLHELEGHTLRELAAIFNVPLQTIYSRLRVARAMAREAGAPRTGAEPAPHR